MVLSLEMTWFDSCHVPDGACVHLEELSVFGTTEIIQPPGIPDRTRCVSAKELTKLVLDYKSAAMNINPIKEKMMTLSKVIDTRIVLIILTLCSLAAIDGCGQTAPTNLPPEQAQAVTALDELGVAVTIRDDKVIFIDFYSIEDTASAVVHLKPFVGLKKLNFSSTRLTDDELTHLAHLVNLEELAMNGTQVTNAGLKHIAGLGKLKLLNLDDTTVSDVGLVHLKSLTNLKRLHLNKTEVTDAGLSHLVGLKNLESLLLYGTYVTPRGADILCQSLPDLKIVAPKSAIKPTNSEQNTSDP